MARPQIKRKICVPPKMIGFKPYGFTLCEIETIKLTYEGYESIRLVNYEMLSHEQAAEQMNISRPTLTRVYNKALKIVASAMIECKAIEIKGGNYHFEQEWFRCKKCHKLIQGLDNHTRCKDCTMFGTDELIHINSKSNQLI